MSLFLQQKNKHMTNEQFEDLVDRAQDNQDFWIVRRVLYSYIRKKLSQQNGKSLMRNNQQQ